MTLNLPPSAPGPTNAPGPTDLPEAPTYEHLSPGTQGIMTRSDEERIAFAERKLFIRYPAVVEQLEKFERLLTLPRASRPRGLLVLQNTNAGKSSLVEQFLRAHPADPNPGGEAVIRPVIRFSMPPFPTEAKLYNAVLQALGVTASASERMAGKLNRVTDLLIEAGVKVIVIDESQHLGEVGVRAIGLLQILKHCSAETGARLIVVGLRDTFQIFAKCDELSNRLDLSVLPRLDSPADFLPVLKAYEQFLPLRQASGLVTPELARPLLVHSERLMGELETLLKLLTVCAIRQGDEQITPELIQQVVKSGQWRDPSRRRESPSEL